MSFYVQKTLAHGPIRFGVSPRQALEEIDSDPGLSTGRSGEFVRKRTHGFFFADMRPIGAPSLPSAPSIRNSTFADTLREGGIGFIVLMIIGAIFILIGLSVIVRKPAARAGGVFEVILGIAMIAAPIVLTAKKRHGIRLNEEKERAQREERESRFRAMLEGYAAALEKLRQDPSDANFAAVTQQREQLEVPYKVWSQLAKRTVLQIGFDALARLTPAKSEEVSALMSRAGDAVGLMREDVADTKLALYSILVWHLLADDRLGTAQSEQLDAVRRGFGISEADAPEEKQAVDQFGTLRGMTRSNLPRTDCTIKLQFREHCIHATRGTLMSEKAVARGTGSLFITNKRVVIDVRKALDVPLMQIDDVEVDADRNLLTIRAAKPQKPVTMQVDQPIFTGALIDLATSIDERPRGFA